MLLRLVDLDLSLSTVVSMAWFLGVAAGAAPLLGAVLVVSEFTWFGLVPSNDLGDTIVSFWIGDAIGVLTVAPLILLAATRLRLGRARERAAAPRVSQARTAETVAQAAVLTAAIALVASQDTGDLDTVYLLFIPMIWIGLRRGVAGASMAVSLTCLLTVLLTEQGTSRHLQLFLITFAATALILGAIVTDRARARREIEAQAALLSAVIQSTTDAVYLKHTEDFKYVTVNESAAALAGLSRRPQRTGRGEHVLARAAGRRRAGGGVRKAARPKAVRGIRSSPGSRPCSTSRTTRRSWNS